MRDVVVDAIVEAIAADGYAIVPDVVPDALVDALRESACRRDAAGEFVPAGVGRGSRHAVVADIRTDRICWIEPAQAQPAEVPWFAMLETLRRSLNAELMLGLFDFEGHYAIYPPGGGYARHRDRFRDDDTRVLSCVLYLNRDWREADGGILRLYAERHAHDVSPGAGTFVAFLSDRFEHEVQPTRRERYAFTGWFRRRGI